MYEVHQLEKVQISLLTAQRTTEELYAWRAVDVGQFDLRTVRASALRHTNS